MKNKSISLTVAGNYPAITAQYTVYLHQEERSANTIAKYNRDLSAFWRHLSGGCISKEQVRAWKEQLTQTHAPASVNSMLSAVNSFLDWAGMPEHKVKPLKIQRIIFAKPDRELTQQEYRRLVQAAERGNNRRLAMLLQTICATGIRVSELRFITVEAVRAGSAVVDNKGKRRTVLLPRSLCHLLLQYCKAEQTKSGIIFCTSSGKPIDRTNIWKMMKDLCKVAGVAPSKVFPHNLRHLFARTYYQLEKDLSRLADILGHTNVNTTKIYTIESGVEHAKQLDRMQLVCIKI